MSFSFSKAGTRDEVLSSLSRSSLPGLSEGGERVRYLMESFLGDAAEVSWDGMPVRYEVSAFGQYLAGAVPSLSVKIVGRYGSRQ